MFCAKCGKEIENKNFCPFCGAKNESSVPTEVLETATAEEVLETATPEEAVETVEAAAEVESTESTETSEVSETVETTESELEVEEPEVEKLESDSEVSRETKSKRSKKEKKPKKGKRIALAIVAIVLAVALLVGTAIFALQYLFNGGTDEESEEELEAGEEQVVPEAIAQLFGVDPDEYDSDDDGLSNYVEIYITGTDPTLPDTDEDGTADPDEDADEDGLTNARELELGTDLAKADSDNDGIIDSKEVNELSTDPCKYDTDGDGLSDGDELILGLNPLEQKTDGKTLDSERRFTQELNKENIDERLTSDDNGAIPSLTLNTNGNINNRVTVSVTKSNDFGDSRAVIGKPIDIVGSSIGEGTISFTLKSADDSSAVKDEESFNMNMVCKYNEDGTTEYLETVLDADNNVVTAAVNGEGTYFVMNVKNLFDELGLSLPEDSESDEDEDYEEEEYIRTTASVDSYKSAVMKELASSDTKKTDSRAFGVMAQADIIFIIDTTGSMSDEIRNVKENVGYFVNALKEKGVAAGLALIDYQDIDVDGYDSTRVHKNGTSNWFYDMESYKTAISELDLGNGGDIPESAVDALETARLLDMRPSAGKIFILVTDAGYKDKNRYGIESMSHEIDLLKKSGITCAVVSRSGDKGSYSNLYNETNGIWADITGDFYTELMLLADKIGTDIVGDGYWIYLDGPIPMPVRLEEEPTAGSDVDTDKDGKPDVEELESLTPTRSLDLDALITKVSKGVITGTDYGVIKMYKYESNPVVQDTDFDGIKDKDDKEPKNNTFSGEMSGMRKLNAASYTFDYRDFVDTNTIYNKDIATASLVFANTIYSGGSFKYGNTGEQVSDIKSLLDLHGFDKLGTFDLKTKYSDDDVSEVGVGYHDVDHNGVITRVIAVVVRGTNGTTEEWSSNFDMGNPSEWDSDYHKGFFVTQERIRTYLDEYVSSLDVNASDTVYWITGHSRGAAIANILASRLIDDGNRVAAYTFATPATTVSENWNDTKYNSIFNFANNNDVVTYVPLPQWDFNRFGITYERSIIDSSLEDEWCEQTGESNYSALKKSLINTVLNRVNKSCSSSWEDVYEYSGKQTIDAEQYGYISERAKKYCRLEKKDDEYYLYPSTAFILQLLAEFIAEETPSEQKSNNVELLKEFWNTKYAWMAVLLLGDAKDNWYNLPHEVSGDLLFDTHAPATYYMLIP